jgi:hypothetical protein
MQSPKFLLVDLPISWYLIPLFWWFLSPNRFVWKCGSHILMRKWWSTMGWNGVFPWKSKPIVVGWNSRVSPRGSRVASQVDPPTSWTVWSRPSCQHTSQVNRQCSSSLQATASIAAFIKATYWDLFGEPKKRIQGNWGRLWQRWQEPIN